MYKASHKLLLFTLHTPFSQPGGSLVGQICRARRSGQVSQVSHGLGQLDEAPHVLGQHERMSARTSALPSLQYEL